MKTNSTYQITGAGVGEKNQGDFFLLDYGTNPNIRNYIDGQLPEGMVEEEEDTDVEEDTEEEEDTETCEEIEITEAVKEQVEDYLTGYNTDWVFEACNHLFDSAGKTAAREWVLDIVRDEIYNGLKGAQYVHSKDEESYYYDFEDYESLEDLINHLGDNALNEDNPLEDRLWGQVDYDDDPWTKLGNFVYDWLAADCQSLDTYDTREALYEAGLIKEGWVEDEDEEEEDE